MPNDHCCDGSECGCLGLPINPPPEAEEALFAEEEAGHLSDDRDNTIWREWLRSLEEDNKEMLK